MRRPGLGVALAFVLASCGGGGEQSGPAQPAPLSSDVAAAGCSGAVRFVEEGRRHVPDGTTVEYRTQPPTSGDHYAKWGATGTHAVPLADERQVHNLEHGQVAIQYVPGSLSAPVYDGLVALTRSNPRYILMAPRPAEAFVPASDLVLTAWQVMQRCPEPAAGAVDVAKAFVAKFGKKAPETVPGTPVEQTPPR